MSALPRIGERSATTRRRVAAEWTRAQFVFSTLKIPTRKLSVQNWISLQFDDWNLLSGARELPV